MNSLSKRLFLDTEFTGLTQDTTLISIALVADTGETFYAEATDFDTSKISEWLQENVINQLFLNESIVSQNLSQFYFVGKRLEIAEALKKWLAQFESPYFNTEPFLQIWADVPHYDWVLFCELFGGAFGIPQNIHYMPMDVATMLYFKNINLDTERESLANVSDLKGLRKHNALYDTYLIKSIFENLNL